MCSSMPHSAFVTTFLYSTILFWIIKKKKINQQISIVVIAIRSVCIRKYNSTRQSKSKQPNKLTIQQTDSSSTLVPDEHLYLIRSLSIFNPIHGVVWTFLKTFEPSSGVSAPVPWTKLTHCNSWNFSLCSSSVCFCFCIQTPIS
jgi:hypothetical protein